jgi:hypothetical protein
VLATEALMTRLLILVAILVSGCVTKYAPPDESQPHATLRLSWSPIPDVLYGGAQHFYAYQSLCQTGDREHLASVATTIGLDRERVVRLRPGKEIFILSWGTGSGATSLCGAGAICIEKLRCINYLSFTPEAGKVYEIKQVSGGADCTTGLTEDGSNRPPKSLRRYSKEEMACRLPK